MSHSRAIQNFRSHFSDEIRDVGKVPVLLFRKILLVGIIDTLSRAAYPNVKEHRKRFIKFIDNCSDWLDKDRVSAQHLFLRLQAENKTARSTLFELVKETVERWPEGATITPDQDISFEQAVSEAADDEKKLVCSVTYKHLLYTCRNHLVHEFREPGYPIEFDDDTPTPFYRSMAELEMNAQAQAMPAHDRMIMAPWQLVFSSTFFTGLCENSLDGLIRLLQVEKRDPYESFDFGNSWT